MIWAFASSTLYAQSTKVDDNSLIGQWLETERLISTEQLAFEKKQAQSQQLLSLYDAELTNLTEELKLAGQNAPLLDEEFKKLQNLTQTTEKARRTAISQIKDYQPKVLALYRKLPAPLQEQLKNDFLQLANEVSNRNVGDQLNAIVRILSDASKFNRSYLFEEHPITLAGEKFRAKVFYLGLSKAFFLAGEKAGYGQSTDNGWQFTEDSSLKKQIKKAFDVREKEIPSSYLELPLEVK